MATAVTDYRLVLEKIQGCQSSVCCAASSFQKEPDRVGTLALIVIILEAWFDGLFVQIPVELLR